MTTPVNTQGGALKGIEINYQQAFTFFSLGYGTAIALVLVVIGALFSVIFVRASRTAL